MNQPLALRNLEEADCTMISKAFKQQGWNKPVSMYLSYFELQKNRERDIILAEWKGNFAGYLTIQWQSSYPPFREKKIPEIVDFNVLKKFQRKGIGTCLMDEAEKRIRSISSWAGIGFGLYKDYGPAQILYVKRGYIPDGRGIVYNLKIPEYGEQIIVDDNIAIYLIKEFKS